ncbi:hypothetical protein HKX48_001796 [Thoreauomyces humboldtii]|nr:hypothetical protein HKX48_001796 [Thoreauomyces humboldtii]
MSTPTASPAKGGRPEGFSAFHEVIFVLTICMAQVLTQAGLAQVIAPLHYIGDSLGTTDQGDMSWFAAGYSLTVGTFILVAGRTGDILGYKKVFMAGFLWFGIASLATGFSVYAKNTILFDVLRTLQGLGPAFLLPNGLAIMGSTYPPGPRKNMVFSLFGATAPLGFLVGAVFSSLFAQLVWWPWAYWVMGMVCLLLVIISYFVIPTENRDPSVVHKRFDWFGSVMGVIGLVLINVAWNQAPAVGWGTPYVYVCLIVGLGFLVGFAFVERKVAAPLLPSDLFTRDTMFVLGCIACGWASFGIWIYFLWIFIETLRDATPLTGTAFCAPVAISGVSASIATGRLLGYLHTSYVMMISMCAFTIGTILIATAPIDQTYWAQMFPSIVIMPWGMDMSFPAATIILSNSVPPERQGIAASLVNTVVNYSISIGLGIAGTVMRSVDNREGGATPLEGLRSAWYTGIALGGLGILLSSVFVVHNRTQRTKKVVHEEHGDDDSSTYDTNGK